MSNLHKDIAMVVVKGGDFYVVACGNDYYVDGSLEKSDQNFQAFVLGIKNSTPEYFNNAVVQMHVSSDGTYTLLKDYTSSYKP